MPGLNTQMMLATARARFSGFQIRLPSAGGARASQLQLASASAITPQPVFGRQLPARGIPAASAPGLFLAASLDQRDIDMQRVCNSTMDTYLTRICTAISQAHDMWRLQVTLVQVRVNGPTATGGSLVGGAMGPELRQRGPRDNAWQRARSEAIADAVGFCWQSWQQSISVPTAPWYPAFAAFPGPVAPPTPNVPFPLVALLQNPALLNSTQLKFQMQARYRGDNEWPNELFDAVAAGLERAFQVWVPTQMVTNVLATGPVPTFAPPYVPVGPVVGGVGNQLAGAWSA